MNDNRDVNTALINNKLLIFSEHTSNDIKYIKIDEDEASLLRSSEGFDMGAQGLVDELSERLKCLAVCANFSKLLIDPAMPIVSNDLIRLYYKEIGEDGKQLPVSFNINGYDMANRLDFYYLEYHRMLIESMEFLEPEFILNIHTHDPDTMKESNPSDVILYNPE